LTARYFSDMATVYAQSVDRLFSTTASLLTIFKDWIEHLPLAAAEPARADDIGSSDLDSEDLYDDETLSINREYDDNPLSASYDWRWASAAAALAIALGALGVVAPRHAQSQCLPPARNSCLTGGR